MERKTILIAEDELLTAYALKLQLEQWGFYVPQIVSSGLDIIKSAKHENPDLILMDIFLRDNINGVEAVKEIHKFCLVPVIYISASQDQQTYDMIKETQYYDFISKPYSFSHVKELIENLFFG